MAAAYASIKGHKHAQRHSKTQDWRRYRSGGTPSLCAVLSPNYSGSKPPPPPRSTPWGHHLGFTVPDYGVFATGPKSHGTDVFEKTQPDGRARLVFFLDPDGPLLFFPVELVIPAKRLKMRGGGKREEDN
ncbi:hypothetical protein TRIUR3_12275 [Triticum urartu]|uniref:Uncharacterized protein n=1 Tax=Triticum urartu TaxID=4572 RepID=M7Z8Z8_TRIUA|nr:hypothetical protein TRIUR3_12275 [Triticum urartu]